MFVADTSIAHSTIHPVAYFVINNRKIIAACEDGQVKVLLTPTSPRTAWSALDVMAWTNGSRPLGACFPLKSPTGNKTTARQETHEEDDVSHLYYLNHEEEDRELSLSPLTLLATALRQAPTINIRMQVEAGLSMQASKNVDLANNGTEAELWAWISSQSSPQSVC